MILQATKVSNVVSHFMRVINFMFALLVGSLNLACKDKTEEKATKVELISISQTDTPREPPPPSPPISNFMTLQEWLVRICDTERPDKSIIAYNFGLFETENGYTIYLTGSKEYDKNDSDWAINDDFQPSLPNYPLPSKDYKNLKWKQVLDKVKSQLNDFTKTDNFKNSFFAKATAITAGFDDGDLVRIK